MGNFGFLKAHVLLVYVRNEFATSYRWPALEEPWISNAGTPYSSVRLQKARAPE